MTLGGIKVAQQSAVTGIAAAQGGLERAASTIAAGNTRAPAAMLTLSDEARALGARAIDGSERTSTVADAIMDLSMSTHLNAANVKVLQTAEQMYDVLGSLTRK